MKTGFPSSFPTFLLAIAAGLPCSKAEVTVNSPQTITRRVVVQPIRTKKTNGETAVLFGTPTQEIYIKTQVNRIFAQIGVRIDWLTVNDYTNDFAYDGSPANYTNNPRPTGDLGIILANAPTPPKSPNAIVINMFFIEIVPFFKDVPENTANGYAGHDYNGITIHIGDTLPTYEGGRDVAAHIIAHEIAHNLGLAHDGDTNNLMFSGQATSARLTSTQKSTIFTNHGGIDGFDFLQTLPPATNYDQWHVTNTVPGGADDDPDLDGLDNVIEFMFSLNPHVFSALPQPVSGNDGLIWTLPKQSGAVADGIPYQVETSGTLGAWLPAGSDSGRSVIVQNDASALVVRLQPGADRSFMRMILTIPATIQSAPPPAMLRNASTPPPPPYPGDSMTAPPPGD